MKEPNLKHDLQNIVAKNLKCVKKDEKVVLGVSGGADSVFLLHVLINILNKDQVVVAHMDHCLRDVSSEEKQFVEGLCNNYDVQFFCKTVDINKLALSLKENTEQCARKERYNFFDEIKKQVKAKFIVTAHHQDDLAETVLMNILRGSSVHGLVGIKMIDRDLIRPILDIKKSDILNYCEIEELDWMEDESNQDVTFSRNFIRNEIIPKIMDKFPFALDRISNLSTYADELSEDLEDKSINFLNSDFTKFNITEFSKLKNFQQKDVLVCLYKNLYKNKIDISTAWLDELIDFILNSKNNSTKEFGINYTLLKEYDWIAIVDAVSGTQNISKKVKVKVPSDTSFGDFTITTAICDLPIDFKDSNCYFCYLDLDLTGSKIYVRGWQNGDKFYPFGSTGRKKLQDLFTDAKTPKRERDKVPIFLNENDEIIWVGGYRIDERYKITDTTKHCLKISIK